MPTPEQVRERLSDLLGVLMEDRRRNEARTEAAAPVRLASRADKIIAEGDHKRTAYRAMYPTADSAMIHGAQIGFLHAQVRMLCNECDMSSFPRDPKLIYVDVAIAGFNADLTVGCKYSPGEPMQAFGPPEDCHEGEPEELELYEIWGNGIDLAAVLSLEVVDAVVESAILAIRATNSADDGEPQ